MNWLNRLDDALDKVLTPQNSRHGNNSSSALRDHPSALADHILEKLGDDDSDDSHGFPVILPSRSLEVVGASVPGRVRRRRSEGTIPSLPSNHAPVIPEKLKRRTSHETTEKQNQYPGNVKRRAIPKVKDVQESSSDSESEAQPTTSSSPITTKEIVEDPHSANNASAIETLNEINRTEVELVETVIMVNDHQTDCDDKYNIQVEMQKVIDDELDEKLLQTDEIPEQSTMTDVVKSVGSMAKTKVWGFLQANRNVGDNVDRVDSPKASPIPAMELKSDQQQADARVTLVAANEIATPDKTVSTKEDEQPELSTRSRNRREDGGIVVALFSDSVEETRVQPSHGDSIVQSDVATVHDEAHKLSLSPAKDVEQPHKNAVEGSILSSTESPLSTKKANQPNISIDANSLQVQTEQIKDQTPANSEAESERSTPDLEKKSTQEVTASQPTKIQIVTISGSSGSKYTYHEPIKDVPLPSHRKECDASEARDVLIDPPSVLKAPARNGSLTLSEKVKDSSHRSVSGAKSDFDVDSTISIWSNFNLDVPFDKNRNRHGMVNLRLLRARKLSCSTGSFIQGTISLQPWKGKVRTKSTKTFSSSKGGHGVCAVWDDSEENRVSMVHAYSSDESPTPTIEIDLTVSPLGMGLLGFGMGTLSLSCEDLLMNPYRVCRYWLTFPETKKIPGATRLASPMLQVEAMFEPTTVETEISDGGDVLPPETIEIPEDALTFQSARNGSQHEFPFTPERRGSKGGVRADDNETASPVSNKTPPFSAKSQRSTHSQTNQHLLRLRKFRLPATCCVCNKSIMSAIRARPAYRCEKCKVDCCEDCMLQVDIKMPCGSLEAQDVAKHSIQNKLSLNSILNTVAPVGGNVTLAEGADHPSNQSTGAFKGIGIIEISFLRAYVLDEPWSPESDAGDILTDEKTSFKTGDYYMRMTRVGSKDSARTQTIQNSSKPVFDSQEMILNVPHYGCAYRIDLVDALTDKPIGSSFLTTQSILQLQRDSDFGGGLFQFLNFFGVNQRTPPKIPLRIDLRHDMKDATTLEYFSPPPPSPHSSKVHRGDIVGYTDILVAMKEDYTSLYGDDPYECPPRPPNELNMRLFQLHLTRLSTLIETLKDTVNGYIYVISWKNPIVTLLSFFLSLQVCATFNPAFLGSLPCFCVVVIMMTSALRHLCFHSQREYFLRKEVEKRRKEENIVLKHSVHRPVGEIGISISAGRNISSLEFGIAGSVMCRAFWNTEGLKPNDKREKGGVRPVVHEIGSTDRVYSTNPVWKEAKESSLTKRLRSIKHFNRESAERIGSTDRPQFIFPVLQPSNTHDGGLPVLEPWESSMCTIDIEVDFTDIISIFPDSEATAGVISIPFTEVYRQKEINGWFKLKHPDIVNSLCNPVSDNDGTPQVFLKLWWTPPINEEDEDIERESDTNREESVFIQEEMMRSAIIQAEARRGVIGSSIGAISSVRGLTGHLAMVQNSLGQVLDTVEAICNAVTFTDPWKSTILLGIAVALWIFFSLVSMKFILYALVLGQYGATFFGRFGSLLSTKSAKVNKKSPSPIGIWIMNAFRGIPTFEDLRRTYFWESLRRGVREAEQFSEEKRGKRLKMLFRARWYSSIQILSSSGDRWKTCFAIIQGHRFTWWSSVNDFDEGCQPLGSIFLSGHSGLATPSPLELKQVSHENLSRLVCLFGKGVDKQERLSMLTPSCAGKDELEQAISHAISLKAE